MVEVCKGFSKAEIFSHLLFFKLSSRSLWKTFFIYIIWEEVQITMKSLPSEQRMFMIWKSKEWEITEGRTNACNERQNVTIFKYKISSCKKRSNIEVQKDNGTLRPIRYKQKILIFPWSQQTQGNDFSRITQIGEKFMIIIKLTNFSQTSIYSQCESHFELT